jgi:RNA polymerase sigma factor (sigma-70 family)
MSAEVGWEVPVSVEFGGGSTDVGQMAEALRDGSHKSFAYLYESYAARLFDYCEGVLGDPTAATDAVQDSLLTVNNAQTGRLPDPDRLRVSLYTVAHRQCLGQLPRRRIKPFRASKATTLDEFVAEQVGTAYVTPAATEEEMLRIVAEAIDRLDDRDGAVLSLAFRHEIRDADLATVLGVSQHRARAMLAAASERFQKSAAVVTVLRAGSGGCADLEAVAGRRDPVPPPLTRERRRRVTEHVESCARCAGRRRGGQVFGPELLAALPLVTPPLTLRLRIERTAQAVGSYRGGTRSPGGRRRPFRPRGRRGPLRTTMISMLGLVILAVPGVVLYRIESAPAGPRRPTAAEVSSGVASVASAGPSLISPEFVPSALDPPGPVRQPRVAPQPGFFAPAPLAAVPLALPQPGPRPIPATRALHRKFRLPARRLAASTRQSAATTSP